jgi:transcriptional regulator with XRE-family HTH domain
MSSRKLINLAENISIGAKLRRIRTERNLTLRELGKRLGVSYQQIQRYESGDDTMSVAAMKIIAATLEVDACEICGCR